jgi:protein-disulfide isomerase
MKNKVNNIVVSVIIGSLVISASLVFLGFQIASGSANTVAYEDIEAGIEAYVQKQQDEYTQAQEQASTVTFNGDLKDDDAILGDPDAPLTLIEFSDYQCPYCRTFYNQALPQIKEKYIDTGQINLVYRDFPLNFHDGAIPAAAAAECAREQGGDEVYFQMHDKIFDGQNDLGHGTVKIPNESLTQYAEDLDLDMNEFEKCIESDDVKAEIAADLSTGQKVGISGTPGFILDGKLIEGAQPFEVFDAAIQAALNNN